MAKTNPNGANQFRADPRQELFLSYYFNPKSATFSNAVQSAIKAGYTEEYANSITRTDNEWFAEAVRDNNRLQKAEKVLDEMLEMPVQTIELPRGNDRDEDEEPESYLVTNPALVKIKQDTAKFIAERMGKHKYSTRNEVTGANGAALIPTEADREAANKALEDFLGEQVT